MEFSVEQIQPLHILPCLEFLSFNNISPSSIANHMSAVNTSFNLCALDVSPFSDPRLKFYNKALILNRLFKACINKIIDIPLLSKIIHQCSFMYMGFVFKAVYLVAYFSFLRISNLIPYSSASYSSLQQLFAHPGLYILIKWLKTLQMKNAVRILKLPALASSPLCPVAAVKKIALSITR